MERNLIVISSLDVIQQVGVNDSDIRCGGRGGDGGEVALRAWERE